MATPIIRDRGKNTPINPYDIDDQEYFYLTSNWVHRAWVVSGFTTLFIALSKSISLTIVDGSTSSWIHLVSTVVIGYLLADLTSGVYHWALDNYGSPKLPVFGFMVESFLRHHRYPSAIAMIPFSRHHYIPAAIITVIIMPINVLCNNAVMLALVCAYASLGMLSLQIHAWAHTPKSKLPSLVVALQDARVFVSGKHHMAHHRPPHNTYYCGVSGLWNRFLAWSRFFDKLEKVVFYVFGVKPRHDPGDYDDDMYHES